MILEYPLFSIAVCLQGQLTPQICVLACSGCPPGAHHCGCDGAASRHCRQRAATDSHCGSELQAAAWTQRGDSQEAGGGVARQVGGPWRGWGGGGGNSGTCTAYPPWPQWLCAHQRTEHRAASPLLMSCFGSNLGSLCCAVLCPAALLPPPRSLLIRDLPHATIKVDAESAASGPVADHQGPHFAIMKAALQQHWKLDQPGSPAVPVLPVLVPGEPASSS
jgi:hypothetical protein